MLNHKNYEDIMHKYAQSIIFYKGEPVMCIGAVPQHDGCQVRYSKLGPNYRDGMEEEKRVSAEDDAFCDGPFKLGYVNGVSILNEEGMPVRGTSFVARAPIRKYKQGLSSQNLVFYGRGLSYNVACRMPEFVDMLKGKYPTYNQCVKVLGDAVRQIAYHRHFAIGIGKLDQAELFYRGQIVGQGKDYKNIELAPRFRFLQEAFDISKQAA